MGGFGGNFGGVIGLLERPPSPPIFSRRGGTAGGDDGVGRTQNGSSCGECAGDTAPSVFCGELL